MLGLHTQGCTRRVALADTQDHPVGIKNTKQLRSHFKTALREHPLCGCSDSRKSCTPGWIRVSPSGLRLQPGHEDSERTGIEQKMHDDAGNNTVRLAIQVA
jgi:hypothetical protein